MSCGEPCPEGKETLEKLGEVRLIPMPGEPDHGPVKIKVVGPMPDGVPRPPDGSFEDGSPNRSPSGGTAVFRRLKWRYVGDEERCEGPFKYHVCFYKLTQDVVCHGHVFSPPRDLDKLKEEKELCGVCIEWIIEKLLSGGMGAAPKLLSKAEGPVSGASAFDLATLTERSQLGMGITAQASAPVTARISSPAFNAIVSGLALQFRKKVDIPIPPSLKSGWADISEIADDVRELNVALGDELTDLFDHLASTRLHSPLGTHPDEAWINAAGSYSYERWGEFKPGKHG